MNNITKYVYMHMLKNLYNSFLWSFIGLSATDNKKLVKFIMANKTKYYLKNPY